MSLYLFDIDGTVADASHRLHYIRKVPQDWESFFKAVKDDKLIVPMADLAYELGQTNLLFYVTGRPERTRIDTEKWLNENELLSMSYMPHIYMRSDTDRRPDYLVKRDLLKKIRDEGYEPTLAFEDRTRVVKMWRENGVPCCQVSEGDY
jgi:hypothetical protein